MTGLDHLDVEIAVVLGKARMPLRRLLKLGRGAVVALDSTESDRVDILANGLLIARGHVTVTGRAVSVEVTEMVQRETVVRAPGTRIGGDIREATAVAA